MNIRQINVFQTADGGTHHTQEAAEDHTLLLVMNYLSTRLQPLVDADQMTRAARERVVEMLVGTPKKLEEVAEVLTLYAATVECRTAYAQDLRVLRDTLHRVSTATDPGYRTARLKECIAKLDEMVK